MSDEEEVEALALACFAAVDVAEGNIAQPGFAPCLALPQSGKAHEG